MDFADHTYFSISSLLINDEDQDHSVPPTLHALTEIIPLATKEDRHSEFVAIRSNVTDSHPFPRAKTCNKDQVCLPWKVPSLYHCVTTDCLDLVCILHTSATLSAIFASNHQNSSDHLPRIGGIKLVTIELS